MGQEVDGTHSQENKQDKRAFPSHRDKIVIALVIVAVILVVIYGPLLCSHSVYAPMVVVNGVKYVDSGRLVREDPGGVYLGDILSSVPIYQSPTENFQENSEFLVGEPVYMVGQDIFIYHKGCWLKYIVAGTQNDKLEGG